MENRESLEFVKAGEYEEFIAYDLKGKAIALQKNTEHPGTPFEPQAPSSTASLLQGFKVRKTAGNIRFFSNVSHVSNQLRQRLNQS